MQGLPISKPHQAQWDQLPQDCSTVLAYFLKLCFLVLFHIMASINNMQYICFICSAYVTNMHTRVTFPLKLLLSFPAVVTTVKAAGSRTQAKMSKLWKEEQSNESTLGRSTKAWQPQECSPTILCSSGLVKKSGFAQLFGTSLGIRDCHWGPVSRSGLCVHRF